MRSKTIGAVLVLAALATAGPAQADEPSTTWKTTIPEEKMAEARKQFQAGVNLLDDPDGARYEDAYRAFKKAYELSRSPKVLGNIGFCAFHLERDGEAIDAYQQYLKEASDVDERERAQISKDLATLTSTVVRVRVAVPQPGSFVLVDTRVHTKGAKVENTYELDGQEVTLRLRPGRHIMKVKSPSKESLPTELTLEPNSDVPLSFSFPEKKEQAPPPPVVVQRTSLVGPVVLGVAGALALGAGAVTGILARGKTSDIESACPNNLCPADFDLSSERSSAKTLGTVADVSFIGGAILLGGAVLWYVLLPKSGSTRAAAWSF